MVIRFDEQMYDLAKSVDYSDLGKSIRFDDAKQIIELSDDVIITKDYFGTEHERAPIWIMLACISDEVERSGLSDDQEKVLPRGRALYELYDAIYYNLPVREEE